MKVDVGFFSFFFGGLLIINQIPKYEVFKLLIMSAFLSRKTDESQNKQRNGEVKKRGKASMRMGERAGIKANWIKTKRKRK